MTPYEELLNMGQDSIFDFFKNVKLHESQFKYSEINAHLDWLSFYCL